MRSPLLGRSPQWPRPVGRSSSGSHPGRRWSCTGRRRDDGVVTDIDRYVCIHGHFYQPPRENPWLEAIEVQDSAYPYHDWNERVSAECYAPNAASRILDEEGRIIRIVNNYASISFNVGPTLMAWLAEQAPEVYRGILEADRESRDRFAGHGSAMAQPYNHMIMPLANARDQRTQALWGVRDFEHRFGRAPEGMWLPETAVDVETLEVLASLGIAFTVLAPAQAARVRRIGTSEWEDVAGGRVDPTMPYRALLPSGGSIAIFFYDGPVARAVAFEGLLKSGEAFAHRLVGGFSVGNDDSPLVHIATDGETYGHHHHFGDMALAYALDYIASRGLARLTNYAEFLERHPSTHEVEIVERTSWSCAHGLGRWMEDCGCSAGRGQGWTQAWRGPLREALDWLRDTIAQPYEERAARLLRDPWAARDGYIDVILDRSLAALRQFLDEHAARPLSPAETTTVLRLLELQRHAMLMYTSCGWFFDELSGIETTQVLQYAGRVVQLGEELFGEGLEAGLLKRLERAPSNLPEYGNGRRVYELFVRPAAVDLRKVAAHYAIASLFDQGADRSRLYAYAIDRHQETVLQAGRVRLAVGDVTVTSDVTRQERRLTYGVIHFGDHNVSGGVSPFKGDEAYRETAEQLSDAFNRGDLPEVVRRLDHHFAGVAYSLKELFKDDQRRILAQILGTTLREAEAASRRIYELYAPFMAFLKDLGTPQPPALAAAAEFIINTDLRREFGADRLDLERARGLLQDAETWGIALDGAGLGFVLEQTLARSADRLRADPEDLHLLTALAEGVELARSLPFLVNLWRVQNAYYALLHEVYTKVRDRAGRGEREAQGWAEHFRMLGDQLSIRVG